MFGLECGSLLSERHAIEPRSPHGPLRPRRGGDRRPGCAHLPLRRRRSRRAGLDPAAAPAEPPRRHPGPRHGRGGDQARRLPLRRHAPHRAREHHRRQGHRTRLSRQGGDARLEARPLHASRWCADIQRRGEARNSRGPALRGLRHRLRLPVERARRACGHRAGRPCRAHRQGAAHPQDAGGRDAPGGNPRGRRALRARQQRGSPGRGPRQRRAAREGTRGVPATRWSRPRRTWCS